MSNKKNKRRQENKMSSDEMSLDKVVKACHLKQFTSGKCTASESLVLELDGMQLDNLHKSVRLVGRLEEDALNAVGKVFRCNNIKNYLY